MTKLINTGSLPPTFRISDLVRLSYGKETRRTAGYAVAKLLKEKKLIRLNGSMYSRVGDIFYIACAMYGGYIGLSSALSLYGLKEEVEANVYVCVNRSLRPARVLDKIIVPVNTSSNSYGVQIMEHGSLVVQVSTYPKTIFDMLDRPRYANYFDMYRALRLRPMRKEEWKEMLYYVASSRIATARRIGHALEGTAPAWFEAKLKELSEKRNGASFFTGHKPTGYDPKWRIFDSISMRRWTDAI